MTSDEETVLDRSFRSCYDRFRDLNENEIDANLDGERVPIEVILENFPELESNPFGRKLCQTFSSSPSRGDMNFEDFLDMASVLSDNAPVQIKADWAFRVFGNYFPF